MSVAAQRGRVVVRIGSVLVPMVLAVASPLLVVRWQVATWGLVEDDERLRQEPGLVLGSIVAVAVVGLLAGWLWGSGWSIGAGIVACVAVVVAAVPTLGLFSIRFAGDLSPVTTSEVDLTL